MVTSSRSAPGSSVGGLKLWLQASGASQRHADAADTQSCSKSFGAFWKICFKNKQVLVVL